jgi:FkbM family methyltransferase
MMSPQALHTTRPEERGPSCLFAGLTSALQLLPEPHPERVATMESLTASRAETETIADFVHQGQAVRFYIDEPTDVVQKTQLGKSFYEERILDRLRFVIPTDAVIADIGANVGNHTIYFGLFCNPKKIHVFEPNRHLQTVLRKNVALNGLASVDFSCLPFAISGSAFEAKIRVRSSNNWGNGHLVAATTSDSSDVFSETVSAKPLDAFDIPVLDFIKADVEGHELDLISGAQDTIRRCKPVIFIEVGESRVKPVTVLLEQLGYRLIDYMTMYRGQGNYLYVPIG